MWNNAQDRRLQCNKLKFFFYCACTYGSVKSMTAAGRHLGVSEWSNGHISATGDPIHFMFGSRVLFLGTAHLNGAISSSNKSKMVAAGILKKFQMAISQQRLTIYLYSARRAVFAIAQLSCLEWIWVHEHLTVHPKWRHCANAQTRMLIDAWAADCSCCWTLQDRKD